MIYQCLGIDHTITDHYSCYLDLNEQQNKICLNKGGLSTPENLNDPKYRIICADLIKLEVLSVFLWMQDLNGVIF